MPCQLYWVSLTYIAIAEREAHSLPGLDQYVTGADGDMPSGLSGRPGKPASIVAPLPAPRPRSTAKSRHSFPNAGSCTVPCICDLGGRRGNWYLALRLVPRRQGALSFPGASRPSARLRGPGYRRTPGNNPHFYVLLKGTRRHAPGPSGHRRSSIDANTELKKMSII